MGDAAALISFFLVLRSEDYWLWLKGSIDFLPLWPACLTPSNSNFTFMLVPISLSLSLFLSDTRSLSAEILLTYFWTLICCFQLAVAGRQPVRRWHLRKVLYNSPNISSPEISFLFQVVIVVCKIYPFSTESLFGSFNVLFSPVNVTFGRKWPEEETFGAGHHMDFIILWDGKW